jgi:hypothetical protein
VAEPAPRRAAALLLCGAPATGGCPPGIDADAFARALAEDIADLLTELPGLAPAVGFTPPHQPTAEAITWPGTTLVPLPPAGGALELLAALAGLGYQQAAVLAPDVPDLPGLLVAKVFSGLAGAQVGVVPALPAGRLDLPPLTRVPAPARAAGRPTGRPAGHPTDRPVDRPRAAVLAAGLAVLGSRLPAPAWLPAELADLDTPDAVDRLRSAAPSQRDLVVTPAWRRLRTPADLAGLDPGLEGWEATRALLAGHGSPQY